jgi:hypothetical protein
VDILQAGKKFGVESSEFGDENVPSSEKIDQADSIRAKTLSD